MNDEQRFLKLILKMREVSMLPVVPPIRPMVYTSLSDFGTEDIQSVDRLNREHIVPEIFGINSDFMCIDEAHYIDTEDAPHQGKVKKSYHKMNDAHIRKQR